MKYGYYPGCSLEGISVEYDESMRGLLAALDVTFEDVPDWICCGTLAAPSMSRLLGLATPLWNVAQARRAGFEQLVTPCSACLYHFKNAAMQVAEHPALRADVEAVIELPLADPPRTIHPLELLTRDGFEARVRGAVQRDLSDLKVVCYYGCHISRPAKVMQFDDPENPTSMDRLLGWVGVQTLEWPGKVDCCGAHFSMIKPGIVVDLCTRLFEMALGVGADAIVVACPMCHANLDTRQDEIIARLTPPPGPLPPPSLPPRAGGRGKAPSERGSRGRNGNSRPLNMPVLYFSQVLGYALGLEAERLGLKKHIVDPLPLMREKCRQQVLERERG